MVSSSAAAQPKVALSAADQAEIRRVVIGFATELCRGGDNLVERVRPFVTDELADLMGSIDPRNVHIASPGKVTIVMSVPGIVGVTVDYPGWAVIRVAVTNTSGNWLVYAYDQA